MSIIMDSEFNVVCSFDEWNETSAAHMIIKTQTRDYVYEDGTIENYICFCCLKLSKADLHESLIKELFTPKRIMKWLETENDVEEYLDLNPNSNYSYGTNKRVYSCYDDYLCDFSLEDMEAWFQAHGASLK